MDPSVWADGKKLLYRSGETWGIVETGAQQPPSVGDGALDLSGRRVRVDPRVEWKQMFDEGWRCPTNGDPAQETEHLQYDLALNG